MNRMMIVVAMSMASVSTLCAGAEPAAPATAPAEKHGSGSSSSSSSGSSSSSSGSSIKDQIAQLQALQEAVRARLLGVPEEDKKRLADFLKLPATGLVKLLPRDKYEDTVVGMRGGGAYYSFVLRTQEYNYGSDIELQNGRLNCGFAGGDYGYFLSLGDVPIDKAAAATAAKSPEWAPREAAAAWGEYWGDVPVDRDVIWQREAAAFRGGNLVGAMPPQRGVPAKPGNTYLLRSVSPERSDVLVAFRVERSFEEDGSILIAWKLLKEFPAPNPRGLPPELIKRKQAAMRRQAGMREQK